MKSKRRDGSGVWLVMAMEKPLSPWILAINGYENMRILTFLGYWAFGHFSV